MLHLRSNSCETHQSLSTAVWAPYLEPYLNSNWSKKEKEELGTGRQINTDSLPEILREIIRK